MIVESSNIISLLRKPFEVELWQYDTMAGNKLLGSAVIPLAELFTSNYTNIQVNIITKSRHRQLTAISHWSESILSNIHP